MPITIRDPLFVKKIYRDFCLRDVRGRDAKRFLARQTVEVETLEDGCIQIALVEYEDGIPFSPWSFLLWPDRRLRKLRYHNFNSALRECLHDQPRQDALCRVLRRFLDNHTPTPERKTA
jgi:hypothetical protein